MKTVLKQHAFLLTELVKRDFQGRYAGSLLSFLWSFVQPLWLLLLFTFVFSTVMKLKLEKYGVPTDHFGIFLFCGLLPWMAVQEGVHRASTAITDSAVLVKKLRFPSEILVLSVVLGALLHEAIAAGVFVVLLMIVGQMAWSTLPWLAVAVPLQIALTLGLGLVLASVQVFFRDTAQVVTMALTGWFYFTPIVYPLGAVPDWIRPWLVINPLTPIVELYRAAFLGATFQLGREAAGAGVGALLLVLVSAWLFRRLRPSFVDEI
jgi:lipopolysaccharide transport system permease protein